MLSSCLVGVFDPAHMEAQLAWQRGQQRGGCWWPGVDGVDWDTKLCHKAELWSRRTGTHLTRRASAELHWL